MINVSDTKVTLKKGEGRGLKKGGAWIFDNEIATIEGRFTNGDIVSVEDFDGYPMGMGFINQNSKIRVRMLTRKGNQIVDRDFLHKRVENAWKYRRSIMTEEDMNSCRLIFGEADWLPGLVVDKYADILVVESLALGMDKIKEVVLEILVSLMEADGFCIRGIYERSDAPVCKKEGKMPTKGFLYANDPKGQGEGFFNYGEFATDVEIVENGVHYMVDVVNGQKTGFFLDQKFNRRAIHKLVKGKRVLDCFTHMGTFALNAGIAGAREVIGLDISEYATAQATANAKLNKLERTVSFRTANVLDELPRLYEAGEKYDVVILDPPAFTKSKEATKNAIKGYREINMKGMRLVEDGGILCTCSCSHFMTQELFTETIAQAAKAVHKRLRQIEFRTQSLDHPILWAADESYYLKFYIFQVVDEK